MNLAIWKKAFAEVRGLSAGAALLLFLFGMIHCYVASQFEADNLEKILALIPDLFGGLLPIPAKDFATPVGRVAGMFLDPTVVFVCSLWAVARGSEAISGEIHRGTMEVLLAQPVRRTTVVLAHFVSSVAGAAFVTFAPLAGTAAALQFVQYDPPLTPWVFLPAFQNQFSLTFAILGVTVLFSSVDRYRWRTLACGAAFVVINLIVEVIARTWKRTNETAEILDYVTVFAAHKPWQLISATAEDFPGLWLTYNGPLLAVGFLGYAIATVIFVKRDVPAPL